MEEYKKTMIYLDNAATSWPKPDIVLDTVFEVLKYQGGNPGRSTSSLALAAGNILDETRFSIAKLFGISDPKRVIFTLNATDSLNLAINGTLEPGDHVICSSMEHNSVTRPLAHQALHGVEVSKIQMNPLNGVNPGDIKKAIRKNTKLVVMTHVSNVTGTINPIAEIGAVCRSAGVTFLVDASQSAGEIPVDVNSANIDLLAAPGHKGLLGPAGTGVLYIKEGTAPKPVRFGGTGIFSEEPLQPDALPYRYESGTQNTPGIAGLGAALKFIDEVSVDSMRVHREKLTSVLLDGLSQIKGVTIYGSKTSENRGSVVSITVDGVEPTDVALILDTSFGIAVRSGLHCAPDTHRTIGTFDRGGTIRFSPGYFNTEEDIFSCLKAIEEIAGV